MTRITTEHNGHEIHYAENKDVWRCSEMDVDAMTLSALKAKLNKLDADARRVNVPVVILDWQAREIEEFGVVTLIDGPKEAWVTTKNRRGTTQRRKMDMSRLVIDAPVNRLLLKDVFAKFAEAEEEADKMLAAIPRVTAEDLKALTAASQETPHG